MPPESDTVMLTEQGKKLKITIPDEVTVIQSSIFKKKEFIGYCKFCKKLFCGVYGQSNLKRHTSAVHEGKILSNAIIARKSLLIKPI